MRNVAKPEKGVHSVLDSARTVCDKVGSNNAFPIEHSNGKKSISKNSLYSRPGNKTQLSLYFMVIHPCSERTNSFPF